AARPVALCGACLALALAGGCTGVESSKPGATADTARADLDDCHARALAAAPPQLTAEHNTAFTHAASDSNPVTDPTRIPRTAYGRDLQARQDRVAACMRDRGYALANRRDGV